jgi:hypothetical protein
MRKAKYLSNQSIANICKTFDIKPNKAAARRAARKDGDANEWIPTEAVKKIKEIQLEGKRKMTAKEFIITSKITSEEFLS